MIVIVGTAHVINLEDRIEEILKNEMPEAVCVELDIYRYIALKHSDGENYSPSKTFQKLAEFQRKIAEILAAPLGGDMLAAVDKAREIGADVHFIDKDIREIAQKIGEISLREKLKIFAGVILGRKVKSKEDVEDFLKEVSENAESVLEEFRKSFPSLAKILIDEREDYMVSRIIELRDKYQKIVVFVGEAHAKSMGEKLRGKGEDVKIIHLI